MSEENVLKFEKNRKKTSESSIANEYAIGNIAQIKLGDLTKEGIFKTQNLEEVKSSYSECPAHKELIISSPKIIGVYRRFKEPFLSPSLADSSYSKSIWGFKTHPFLVQIGFDPSIFKTDLIGDLVGRESRRMLVVPHQELKEPGEDLEKYSALTSKILKSYSETGTIEDEDIERHLEVIRKLHRSEGLIKPDYNLLTMDSINPLDILTRGLTRSL